MRQVKHMDVSTQSVWHISLSGNTHRKKKQCAVCLHENTTVPTGLTQLKALPACQLLVQGTSQDAGQQQHRPAHRREVGDD